MNPASIEAGGEEFREPGIAGGASRQVDAEPQLGVGLEEFEGVAEGSLSTGVFNGNTRRNISVDAKSRGCVLCTKSFIKENDEK